jgi:K+-sensing histidine kinase KdpD
MSWQQTDGMDRSGWLVVVGAGLPIRRQALGFLIAAAALAVATLLLMAISSEHTLAIDALAYQLVVVVAALIGGFWPALVTAVVAAALLDILFVAPRFTLTVADPANAVALAIFLIVGALVSLVVGQADARLRSERRLAAEVERTRPLEAADRMRTALLAAVGHDLRTPLASAVAAVSSLSARDVEWSDRDRSELLDTARVSLDRLGSLVSDLLDASRLQAGVLAVALEPVVVEEAVAMALASRTPHADRGPVPVDIDPDADEVLADPVLLQRMLENLLDNAERHGGGVESIGVHRSADVVSIRVVDAGPGIAAGRREAVFEPFQREGDADASTGVGLGLALSRGFAEAMSGELVAEETPGGGTTMVIRLPVAPAHDAADRP